MRIRSRLPVVAGVVLLFAFALISGSGAKVPVGGAAGASVGVLVRADPFIGQAELAGSDESGPGAFGSSVALSGDGKTVVVGGPSEDGGVGAAWVFTRASSNWTQQGPKLTGGGESGPGDFGSSVALSGDGKTVVVGGPSEDGGVGAAWVFTRSGSTWTQQGPKLTGSGESGPSLLGSHGNFGDSVALSDDGSTALIGGDYDNNDVGAAWVFTRSGSTWTQQGAKVTGSGESGGEYPGEFGRSVALSGDGSTALIGGPYDNPRGGDFDPVGAAWVFTRSGSTWTQQGAKLTGAGESGRGGFGGSLALSRDGGTALIGGPYDNGVGAAWVFTRAGSTWTQRGSKLTGGGEKGTGHFGWSVALSGGGSTALIGGPYDNPRGGDFDPVGAAWVFTRAGSTWTQQGVKLTGAGESGPGGFGESVALSGDGSTALIGGPYDSHDIGVQSAAIGAAWVFSAAAPSVSIRVPADGARYDIGQMVTASYSCHEGVGGPGLASCTGTVRNGARIDTAGLGPHTLTVTAASKNGQRTSRTVNYTVILQARNGLLVAAPLDGHGLALIDPRTGSHERICTDSTLCGRPVQPRWSPNGLAIAFANAVGARVGILTADGTCLWCMLGVPLSTVPGSHPAFASGGKAATFVSGPPGSARGLWQVGLGGAATHRLLRGAYVDAVWSSTGRLAVVRSGSVWVGGRGRRRLQLRLLARGSAPAWSADGSRLALVRSGWVWVVRIRDGSSRRVARGSSPAWSPDGSEIAYVGRSHFIYVVSPGGGRSRRVGEMGVRSVDWQPQPQPRPAPSSCTPGKGSTLIASSAQALITSSVETLPGIDAPQISWYGCLRALGHKWLLNSQTLAPGYGVSLTGVAQAGRFAAPEFSSQNKYFECLNAASVYDLSNGKRTPALSYDCTPGDAYSGTWADSLSLNASGFTAWRATQLRRCAAARTCIAAQIYAHDDHGTQLLDSAPLDSASPLVNPLANLNLSGNVLTWTRDGTQHQITLQ
jgi:hypothetical protein